MWQSLTRVEENVDAHGEAEAGHVHARPSSSSSEVEGGPQIEEKEKIYGDGMGT